MEQQKYYTLLELEEILHLSKITIREYIKHGTLKGVKLGRQYLVSEENLNEFLKAKGVK